MNLAKLRKLFIEPDTRASGIELVYTLEDQSIYEGLLSGWSFQAGRFSHPKPPFPDAIAWLLWQNAPQEIFPIARDLYLETPVRMLPCCVHRTRDPLNPFPVPGIRFARRRPYGFTDYPGPGVSSGKMR